MALSKILSGPGLILLSIVCTFCTHTTAENRPAVPQADTLPLPSVHKRFGLDTDSFLIEIKTVRKNQTFARIMYGLGLESDAVAQIQKPDSVFNPAKIKAKAKQYIFRSKRDSTPLYWVYQPDPVKWFRIQLTPPYRIVQGKNKSDYKFRSLKGEIHTSLWEAASEQDFPFGLALQLADIYAWTIDFFDLKKGDSFEVLYEEEWVDSAFTGVSRIFTACFHHNGNDIYAIPFIQDNTESYFDRDGNSLKRAFLKAPLRFRRISSRFSYSRMHPVLKIRRPHFGIDYSAPVGTPVHTVGDGKIIYMKQTSGAGKMVKIRHNSIYTTAYLHLSHYAGGLFPGKTVRQGDIIGYVGNTGLSTGPHLDFRFYKNGSPVDPLKIKSPPVTPVKQENMARFDSVKTVMIKLLDTVK